jgi:phytoene synthase
MKKLYDHLSHECARNVTKKYSTSFSSAVRLLAPSIRQDIHNIYGFVRVADEIVDSFHDYPKSELFNRFEQNYYHAYLNGISTNPIINAFIQTVHKYKINQELVQSFLDSMRSDLKKTNYETKEDIDLYIYGSADVVGLMCLKVFVNGDETAYKNLKEAAMRLGSAFQKVNFLRDIKDDIQVLNRSYFPDVNMHAFTQDQKQLIIKEVREDFEAAYAGVKLLPVSSRTGVYVAYRYYNKLFKQLERTAPSQIMKRRIRVSNLGKALVLIDSKLRLKFNTL